MSPFKYNEESQMQQYFKMEKKIASGAKFLITQVGWDWKKSIELMKYLKDAQLDIPVVGNVYLFDFIFLHKPLQAFAQCIALIIKPRALIFFFSHEKQYEAKIF